MKLITVSKILFIIILHFCLNIQSVKVVLAFTYSIVNLIPKKDKYIMHFADGRQESKNEEDISKELGNSQEIAKETKAVYAINKVENNKSLKIIY